MPATSQAQWDPTVLGGVSSMRKRPALRPYLYPYPILSLACICNSNAYFWKEKKKSLANFNLTQRIRLRPIGRCFRSRVPGNFRLKRNWFRWEDQQLPLLIDWDICITRCIPDSQSHHRLGDRKKESIVWWVEISSVGWLVGGWMSFPLANKSSNLILSRFVWWFQ
jgi:hypothetical protein